MNTESTLRQGMITLSGRRTSVKLEPETWDALRYIAARERCSIHDICSLVDRAKNKKSIASAIRTFALLYFRAAATEEGHRRAGHGTRIRILTEKYRNKAA